VRSIVTLIFLVIATLPLQAQDGLKDEQLLELAEASFSAGNDLLLTQPSAAHKEYSTAALYYGSLIERGVNNASLYYNTGNAFYRTGQLGRAILMYRRALLFSPLDPRIKSNLLRAQELQKNQFAPDSRNEVVRIIFFPHYKIPFVWKIWSFVVVNLGFWASLIALRFRKSSALPTILAGIIAVLLLTSLAINWQGMSEEHGVTIADSTIGRMGDSVNYEPSFETPLFQGVEFTVEERRVGWILARLPNRDITWIEEKDCAIVEEL
jgi:tetratricopeptide (TPR) repeat protein